MSPRTEASNQRIRQEQRKKILDAAVSIFARKGFSATKMADIATAADISYGLLYHYFTNKEHIFITLVQDDLEATARLMQNALKQPGTPWV
ncbi:MAG TPA: helix-turn-helix domain-containing protein [Ktedonobacteraceae bacterium]|nr:helix-turn-helix domain-containing protein [Ktedonobacteraceae bacterium]